MARKVRLADAGRAQQQHGRDLQAVAAVLCQGDVALHVVQHLREVGQLFIQVGHVGHARGLNLEALGAALQHAFVHGAQGVVLTLVARLLQPRELALDVARVEHVAHLGHGQAQRRRLGNKALGGHRMLLVMVTSRNHSSTQRARCNIGKIRV